MPEPLALSTLKRRPVAEVVGALTAENAGEQALKQAGISLLHEARNYGLTMREYLMLAVDPNQGEVKYTGLNGYEATLAHLNLPFKDSYEQGITLQAASETFQRFPGTRAMFPEVIDDMLKWQNRQSLIEKIDNIVAVSRTISGVEEISTIVNDDSADRGSYTVSEMSRIPVRSIRTAQQTVGIFKHGSGYRTSYEFLRRARLDILTPFANRVARELEMSKVKAATSILVNGDGVNGAAAVVAQSTLTGYDSGASGVLQYKPMLTWMVNQAQAGVPVDTIVGNYAAFLSFLFLFMPVTSVGPSVAEAMGSKGLGPTFNISKFGFDTNVTFAISSTAPSGKLIGLVKGETLEELVEAGSLISESEQAVLNQTITYVRSESTGYKLAFGDTRSILNYAA